MAVRLKIAQITPDSPDWTCKVQIVDISRHRQSHEKKIKFQNLILEDEQEDQVRAVVYEDDLGYYASKLSLFSTYLISGARVKKSQVKYGRLIHKFYWVIDKETILEHVNSSDTIEKALPLPMKLNLTPFTMIREITPSPAAEIDFVGVVLRSGPLKRAGRNQTTCREVTVTDNQLNHFLFTLWDDFADVEGTELEAKLKRGDEFPVILARNIGVSPYRGLTLQTRFNSTICINSSYPQPLQLLNWAKGNKDALSGQTVDILVGSSGSLAVAPPIRTVISIAEIPAQNPVAVFYIEAEMSIADRRQSFCMLECSGCQQRKRTQHRRQFECTRCIFEMALTDGSGSTNGVISGNVAEQLLGAIADTIFQTTCIKREQLCIKHAQQMLCNRVFYIQVRRATSRGSNGGQRTVRILGYIEKERFFPIIGSAKQSRVLRSDGPIDRELEQAKAEGETSESSVAGDVVTAVETL